MKTGIRADAESLTSGHSHYCPGCGHGIVHRMIAEAIDELGLPGPHDLRHAGRLLRLRLLLLRHGQRRRRPTAARPAVATGIKRAHPDSIVISYQGDGDLAGDRRPPRSSTPPTAARSFTVIFINNAIYGMTGGQMAPTTLVGQAARRPHGRDPKFAGYPIHVCEMLATLTAPRYIERVPEQHGNLTRTKRAIKKALHIQTRARDSPSSRSSRPARPTGAWTRTRRLTGWSRSSMPEFPLGVFRDVKATEANA